MICRESNFWTTSSDTIHKLVSNQEPTEVDTALFTRNSKPTNSCEYKVYYKVKIITGLHQVKYFHKKYLSSRLECSSFEIFLVYLPPWRFYLIEIFSPWANYLRGV